MADRGIMNDNLGRIRRDDWITKACLSWPALAAVVRSATLTGFFLDRAARENERDNLEAAIRMLLAECGRKLPEEGA